MPQHRDKQDQRKRLTRILFASLALVVILTASLLVANSADLKRNVESTTRSYVSDVANQVATDVNARIDEISVTLHSLVNSFASVGVGGGHQAFLDEKAEILGFSELFLVALDGSPIAVTNAGYNVADQAGFKNALAGKTGVTILEDQSLSYAVPVEIDGSVEAVLVGVKDKTNLRKLLQIDSFKGLGTSCITDRSGNVVVAARDAQPFIQINDIFSGKGDESAYVEVQRMYLDMRDGRDGTITFTAIDGHEVAMAYNTLKTNDWILLTLVPADIITADLDFYLQKTYAIVAGTILVLATILILVFVIERRSRKEVNRIAFVDPLTGGMTRAAFEAKCAKLLQTNPDDYGCVASLNIQGFRIINESFGQKEADKVLRHVDRTIKRTLKEGEYSARGEADGFYLILKDRDQQRIEERLSRIIEEVNSFNKTSETPYRLLFTMGVSLTEDDDDIPLLMEHANTARKTANISVCGFYDAHVIERLKREKEIVDLFEGSLANGDFSVHLQPKVSPSERIVTGAEALVRWNHPSKGTIFPSEFIPVLERSGYIRKLDLHVFDILCKHMSTWISQGIEPLVISVNLSRKHFDGVDFLESYTTIADRHAIPHHLIELEVTESIFFDNDTIEVVKKAVEAAHAEGFTCSLDDFGSGFSSLGLLKEFNVDVVKLDRVFFLDDSQRARDVVETIVALAHKLNIATVAEGIESVEQTEFLAEIGCDQIQGYVYSPPMPIDSFIEWRDDFNRSGSR